MYRRILWVPRGRKRAKKRFGGREERTEPPKLLKWYLDILRRPEEVENKKMNKCSEKVGTARWYDKIRTLTRNIPILNSTFDTRNRDRKAIKTKANYYRSRKQNMIFQRLGTLFLPGTLQNVPCSLNEPFFNVPGRKSLPKCWKILFGFLER